MIRDEFNNVEIKNENGLSGREFGKTQKIEFSFHNDNKVPEGELNEKYVGKTVKKVTEVNVEYTNKVPTHGITVVKGTVTATNVATAATSAVVVASTVAVTAIAVATGISVALHDYKYDMNSFLITSKEISYSLTIVDNRNDKSEEYQSYEQKNLKPRRLSNESEEERPFLLKVYNNSYNSSKELFYGYNEGSFTSLTLGDTYNIVLTENRFGGETIFSESFTTYKNSHFRDINIFTSGSAIVATLDYIDELEKYDEFYLTLNKVDGQNAYTFPLEPTTEPQTIEILNMYEDFDFSSTYQCQLSYLDGEEQVTVDKGNIAFDSASIVRGVIWDKTADFIKKEFYVTLDYQDDFRYFDQFELTLQDAEYPEEVSETFPLLSTTAPQKITIPEESSIYLRREYNYMFTYYDSNTGMQEIIESGTVQFTDNSDGKKQFNGVSVDLKPNYEEGCFYVSLDYEDDYGELVSFRLVLTDASGTQTVVYLNETINKQPVKISDYGLDFTKSYDFQLVYYDMAIGEDVYNDECSGTIEFDNSDGTTTFNDLLFDETANFNDRSFVVQLDYRDDVGYLSDFEFILTDQTNGLTKSYYLDKKTEPQTFYCDDTSYNEDSGDYEYDMDIIRDAFSYSYRYFDKRSNDYVVGPTKEFSFSNSIMSEFLGVESSFDFTAETSGDSYVLPIKFKYNNKANSYTGFAVSIQRTGIKVGELRFEGETLTEDWLYGVFVPDTGYSIDDIIDVDGVEMVVTAYQDNVNYPSLDPYLEVYNKEQRFTLEQVKEIHSLSIVSDGIHNGGEIMLSVVYSGPRDYINYKLILEAESGNKYTFNVMLNTLNYSYVLLSETDDGNVISDEDFNEDFINHPMKVSMSYSIFDTSGSSADGEWSDYITKVIYDSYQFSLSV